MEDKGTVLYHVLDSATADGEAPMDMTVRLFSRRETRVLVLHACVLLLHACVLLLRACVLLLHACVLLHAHRRRGGPDGHGGAPLFEGDADVVLATQHSVTSERWNDLENPHGHGGVPNEKRHGHCRLCTSFNNTQACNNSTQACHKRHGQACCCGMPACYRMPTMRCRMLMSCLQPAALNDIREME